MGSNNSIDFRDQIDSKKEKKHWREKAKRVNDKSRKYNKTRKN